MFLLELHYYLTPYVQEELMVDLSGGKKLKISFDIVFPHIICSHLSLDATDVSGEQHINIDHNIFKRKLNENGDPIELPQKDNSHGLATFQYYVKIIPTIYENLRDEKIETNQFAVTRYKKEFGSTFEAITDSQLPGVFFIYEFGPMLVKYSERWRSTLHFLTSVCAITGGILTVAGIIDSFIYHSHRVLKAKIQLGKLG
ncbi:endoplasmic reticulum-Golgi intermediate compartment protein 1-like protein [Sarcoptes scabiei]|uniref:Endoplasmic reticulum-Golgi intermediate compartment protein 3 n=1 Tax=Sarcoptes scabiei TaxID=52283 RepID=A0A132AKL9_SARSC|nr:endoplasmic reticulum-Golgi intermediate compartment protein 1-like protein [Sarcoptes scabiei]